MTDNDIEQAYSDDNQPSRRVTDVFDSRWHVGREIPLALIAALLIQTGGGIWWASTMTSKLDTALQTLAEFRAERYTKDDGRRDRELLVAQLETLKARDAEHDRRIEALELSVNGRSLGLRPLR